MAVPARPVSGAPTASDWGGIVHDQVVVYDIQTGNANTAHSANPISAPLTITFPRPFANPPVIVGMAMNFNYIVATNGAPPTATTVVLQTRRVDGSSPTASVPIQWLAYGPRA